MNSAQFDFHLPEGLIALRPAVPRESARLLVVHPEGSLNDWHVGDLPKILRPGDALVFNDSRVLPVYLVGKRGAATITTTLVDKVADHMWWGFVKNAKRLRPGDEVIFSSTVAARAEDKTQDGRVLWHFSLNGSLEQHLPHIGLMPLPPYIMRQRPADAQDMQDYQTIFARHDGSVAAPTAGLHITQGLLDLMRAQGILDIYTTLHVGMGTFLPVKADSIDDHVMHSEYAEMSQQAAERLNDVRQKGGRIIAVGTTALRTLESAVDEKGLFRPYAQKTNIFIKPGYRFKAIDGLMTNFHLPKSTLFMLVCALSSHAQKAYAHAIAHNYRFYSYGDSSFFWQSS